jgi:hypothetical protein
VSVCKDGALLLRKTRFAVSLVLNLALRIVTTRLQSDGIDDLYSSYCGVCGLREIASCCKVRIFFQQPLFFTPPPHPPTLVFAQEAGWTE